MSAHLDELVADVDCPSPYRVENKICHPVGKFESSCHVLEDFVVNGAESLGDVYPSGVQSAFVGRVYNEVSRRVWILFRPLAVGHALHSGPVFASGLVLHGSHQLVG
ncbi:uncharacterized protein BcabD6B2_46700 [Babesia caballi]|uniref:Uncharacterized protein n=1 Tax=Babesia caballi TaxID=5871 RepID=A0AAV4M007_BABCB|nr:hypothetical protein, conserved [Babesia caballi]